MIRIHSTRCAVSRVSSHSFVEHKKRSKTVDEITITKQQLNYWQDRLFYQYYHTPLNPGLQNRHLLLELCKTKSKDFTNAPNVITVPNLLWLNRSVGTMIGTEQPTFSSYFPTSYIYMFFQGAKYVRTYFRNYMQNNELLGTNFFSDLYCRTCGSYHIIICK